MTETAICPDNHVHEIRKDSAGFPCYAFVVHFTGPCRYNNFRVFKA